jgi:hypothetical protein
MQARDQNHAESTILSSLWKMTTNRLSFVKISKPFSMGRHEEPSDAPHLYSRIELPNRDFARSVLKVRGDLQQKVTGQGSAGRQLDRAQSMSVVCWDGDSHSARVFGISNRVPKLLQTGVWHKRSTEPFGNLQSQAAALRQLGDNFECKPARLIPSPGN